VKPLFTLGQVVATPGALAALEASGESLFDYVARHLSGDWGDVDSEDLAAFAQQPAHHWTEIGRSHDSGHSPPQQFHDDH